MWKLEFFLYGIVELFGKFLLKLRIYLNIIIKDICNNFIIEDYNFNIWYKIGNYKFYKV